MTASPDQVEPGLSDDTLRYLLDEDMTVFVERYRPPVPPPAPRPQVL